MRIVYDAIVYMVHGFKQRYYEAYRALVYKSKLLVRIEMMKHATLMLDSLKNKYGEDHEGCLKELRFRFLELAAGFEEDYYS